LPEENEGSIVDPAEYAKKNVDKGIPQPSDASAPLFQKMDRITVALEAYITNTSGIVTGLTQIHGDLQAVVKSNNELKEALNSLLTTFLMKEDLKKRDTRDVSTPPPQPSPQSPLPSSPPSTPPSNSIDETKILFPEDLENMLSFEETDGYVVVKPRQFLGSDNFSKIAAIVRGVGGEYVSAGKASHFKIPVKKGK
jgi:hypothetical protein